MTNTILQVIEKDNELIVDSRLVAQRLGIEHESFMRTINKYKSRIEKRFGHIRFEIETVINSVKAVNESIFAYLTEDQATTLMTFSKNTEAVIECKLDLVEAFSNAKKAIKQFTIPSTRAEALRLAADLEERLEAEKQVSQKLLQEKQVLQIAIAEVKPKAEFYDIYVSRDGWLTGEQIAKQLSVSTRKMFDVLRNEKVVFYRSGKNIPCARWVEKGWATMRPVRCHDEIVRNNLVFSHKVIMQIFDLLQDNGLIEKNRKYNIHLESDEPKQLKHA
jgi:phage regulator Rha-like protein